MGLESATYVDDVVITNPPGTDLKAQGDDHIRLLKAVLRNTFKRANRPFSFPGILPKSANYTVLSSDDGYTFVVDTTAGPVTLTLPTLTVADYGWRIEVIKVSSDANPIFIAVSTSNINGILKIRRAIEVSVTRVIWASIGFIATRPHGAPIGSTHSHYGASLPNGYLWADGAAFNAANYPELNAVYGVATVPDCRGRTQIGRDNMGVGAAGRVDSAGSAVDASVVRGTGGAQNTGISIAQMPTHTPTGTVALAGLPAGSVSVNGNITGSGLVAVTIHETAHNHPYNEVIAGGSGGAGGSGIQIHSQVTGNATTGITADVAGANIAASLAWGMSSSTFTGNDLSVTCTATYTGNPIGGGNPHNNMQPTIACNVIVLAE